MLHCRMSGAAISQPAAPKGLTECTVVLIQLTDTCTKQCRTGITVEPCCLTSSCRPGLDPPKPPSSLAEPSAATFCRLSLTSCCVVQTSAESLLTAFQPDLATAPNHLASYDQGLEQVQRWHQALQSPPGVVLRTQALHALFKTCGDESDT